MIRRKTYAVLAVFAAILAVALLKAASLGGGALTARNANQSPAETGQFKSTPQRLARGRYLTEAVAPCFRCHSEVDWKAPGAPIVPGKKGGGALFPDEGLPFPLVAPNISPDPESGAGKWTDQELARAIREGIGHDGRRLFPVMPYLSFRVLSDEDLASIIVYLRSIPPVHSTLKPTPLPEPAKAMLPPPMPITAHVPPPDLSNPVKRGEYLVALADCGGCHTPADQQGRPLPGFAFAGGRILKGPWGEVASANLTPDASGISYYDEKLFLRALRTGHVRTRKLNNIMLWGLFKNMTEADLKAIFAYLKTLHPVAHRVDNTEPPRLCKKCGSLHGYGDRN